LAVKGLYVGAKALSHQKGQGKGSIEMNLLDSDVFQKIEDDH